MRTAWLSRISLGHLMVLALAVRLLLFFGGIRGSDAYSYAQHAYNILNGGYDVTAETVYYGFRFPILLATAAAYALFGVGDWSSALFPLLASLITLVLVVRLGTVWFDRETGLWAGLLCAFYPMDVINASLLGPSSFIPCFSAAAVLSYWKAVQWGPDKAKGLLLCLVSGLCIGLAIQTRLVGILLLAVIGLMTFGMGRWVERLRAVLAVGMGCALPLSLGSGYYLYKTGDPLYRLTIGLRWNELFTAGADPEGPVSWAYYPKALFGLDLAGFAWFGFFAYLAVAAVLFAMFRRELGRLSPLLLWLVPVFGYLQFGSMSLTRYLPMLKGYNYLSLISVPVILLGGYLLASFWPRDRLTLTSFSVRRLSASLVAVGLAISSLYSVSRVRENVRDDARPYQMVARMVEENPQRTIFLPHERWALFLNYYLRYETGYRFYQHPIGVGSGRVRYLWETKDPAELASSYVVLHDRYLYFDTRGRSVGRVARLPEYVFDPPEEWRILVQEKAEPSYNSFVLFESGT